MRHVVVAALLLREAVSDEQLEQLGLWQLRVSGSLGHRLLFLNLGACTMPLFFSSALRGGDFLSIIASGIMRKNTN